MNAYLRLDAAAVADVYTSAGQLLPPRSDVIIGKAAIGRYWHEAMRVGLRKLKTIELEIHASAAHELGRYTIDSRRKWGRGGKYIVIWKLEVEKWRMHRDIWNTSGPARLDALAARATIRRM